VRPRQKSAGSGKDKAVNGCYRRAPSLATKDGQFVPQQRKRPCGRVRTPSWWRRARVSSRRSIRVAGVGRPAAPVLKPPRIACRVPTGDADVNGFCPDGILASHKHQDEQYPVRRRGHDEEGDVCLLINDGGQPSTDGHALCSSTSDYTLSRWDNLEC
jgi:hypothetical protein